MSSSPPAWRLAFDFRADRLSPLFTARGTTLRLFDPRCPTLFAASASVLDEGDVTEAIRSDRRFANGCGGTDGGTFLPP